MRVAFLCSSLEPGRDGVGDYCRRLGSEIKKQGYDILLISLNDPWHDGLHGKTNESLPVVRCDTNTALAGRVEVATQALKSFSPDWISLQYVCYGYHSKGLAWRWNLIFAELGKLARHRHLMFHELWIEPPPFHRRLIGLGQQWVVRDLHRLFRPDMVTTSMTSYQCRLSNVGIKSKVLPLFSNIPVAPRDDDRIAGLLRAAGSQLAHKPRTTFLNGVFFGTVHSNFDVTPLIRWLTELQSRATRPVLLTLIGRAGAAGERLAKQIISLMPDFVEVVSLGEQPEEIISQALQFADFGINTGSPEFLGKGGTFAAMREHGLPVMLADGQLDSTILQNGAAPILQFSNKDSVSVVMNYSRVPNTEAEIIHRAAGLIRFFENATDGTIRTGHS